MPRLFVAVDLPAEAREKIRALRDDSLGVRWSPPDQYHVTLRFLGDVADERVPAVAEALAGLEAPTFELATEDLGVFPAMRRPRVLVVRLADEPVLRGLQARMTAALEGVGVEPDPKPFNPHVTFGRVKGADARSVRRFVTERRPFALEPFRVTAFHLYKSVLRPEGAEHRILKSYPLS